MKHRRLALVLLFAAVGCHEEPIRTQRVSKPKPVRLRTLGAIVPRAGEVWFFKLSGPEANVAADEEKFRWFLNSVLFANDPPVNYATPEGWKIDTGGGKTRGGMVQRYATLRTPNGNEAIITKLGPESGELLPNINRWRKEVGMETIVADELAKCTSEISIGGVKGVWTDLMNPGQTEAVSERRPALGAIETPEMKAPVAASAINTPPTASTRSGVKYDAPPGWTALPAQGIRVAAFRMGDSDQAAECTIIPLAGTAGGWVNNINRWRVELKLDELDEAKLKPTVKELVVEGKPSHYADLLAPDGLKRQRTLGVIVIRGSTTWFVKLRGPAETVARNQSAFESFVRSLKLPAGG